MNERERKARIHAQARRCGQSADWAAGVLLAAQLADEYNGVTAHPFRLGDCILGKLNLITKPMVRRNRGAR